MSQPTASPLTWPVGWPHQGCTDSALFKRDQKPVTIRYACDAVLYELYRLGVKQNEWVISSDLRVKQDGTPYANQKAPYNKGVSVWWMQDGVQRVMAIALYDRIADNIYAISKTLEAYRAIGRWGGGEAQARAYTGLAALPSMSHGWESILGISKESAWEEVKPVIRKALSDAHPDKITGNKNLFLETKEAYEEAKKHWGQS